MNKTIQPIPLENLIFIFIPTLIVVFILFKWKLSYKNAMYAISRMFVQLLLIGYFLTYIFESQNQWLVLGILIVVIFISSWISLGHVKAHRYDLYLIAFISIAIGGGVIFIIVTQGVMRLDPWYSSKHIIPISGMVFANSMTGISLAVERFFAEIKRNVAYEEARKIALNAALIPQVNFLFAVGLVSLPGMMTGQILSGVSPLIAARYQIMVMCMIFSSVGISSILFLILIKTKIPDIEKL